ncbi:MAG: HEPN domain-containing protein [Candidatus Marinimicrobia bacterium]|nr:HEPN domain-containing protein [Candidatus Neomarinimicrobiota bacterium]MCH8069076.1 HEPN domain-containing protein [Candidatus Neomarinimicrobiota bacterium]
MKREVKRWIDFANEDLIMAEIALREEIYNQACFHSQQCVEKLLKGFIEFQGEVHPQTHKLIDLLSVIPKSLLNELRNDILLLDRFYILTRYPDALPGSLPEGLPVKVDAEEAIGVAKVLFERIQEEIEM